MAIVRYDPIREIDSVQGEMNRLFDGFFGTGRSGRNGTVSRWIPAMDLVEAGDELVLRADLPGMSEGDVQIEINDSVLTVSGERKSAHEEKGESFYRAERAFGRFSRSLTLPEGVDQDEVKARFADGVLEVRVPKPAERKPHRVAISSGNGRGEGGPETGPAVDDVEGEATEK